MKLAIISLFGLLTATAALAGDAAPILVCGQIGHPGLERIEIFEANNENDVVAYDAEGNASHLTIAPAIPTFFEASIPLPDYQEQQRLLQWRHTGWVVHVYEKDGHDRFDVDCQ